MTKPRNLEEWESQLPLEQLFCRDSSIHHSWDPYTAKRVAEGIERNLICRRCTTIKSQILDNEGYVIRTRMKYPEGYLRPAGSGRITADDNARMRVNTAAQMIRPATSRRRRKAS